MKRTLLNLIIILSLLATSSCHKDKKGPEEAIPEISVAKPIIDSIALYKTYPGYLYANAEVNVVGEVSGRLLTKNFTSGQYVSKGQILFTIDPTTYKQAAERARASLHTAQAQYEYATKQYAALQRALKADAVSQMEVAQAKSNVEQYQADIASAKSSLETAETSLSKCTVRAPISGYVTKATMDPGGYVNGEGAPVTLATIYDNSSMLVNFNIEDSQYELMTSSGGIKNNIYRAVPVQFAHKLPHSYTTDLYYEAPDVEKTTGTVSMRGTLHNDYNELKDGMYCTIRLPYGDNPHAILVKDASIGTDQLGKYLYVVNDSNRVEYRHITVGDIYQDSLRLVTEGIKPDERYVTTALLKVRTGMEIKPILTD